MKARDQQEDHIRHLRTLERALEKMEKQKAQQQQAQVSLSGSVMWVNGLTAPPKTNYIL